MIQGRLSRFLFGTLRGRLILGVAAVHALMMALFIADLTWRQRAMLLDRQQEEAIALSRALATSAAGWIAADDVSGMQELVEVQRGYPELLFAILADEQGHVLAATDRTRRGLYLLDLPRRPQLGVVTATPSLVDVAAPALIGGRLVGWARVGIGQRSAGEKLRKITLDGVLYAAAAVVIGSGIAWFMGRRITRRLYAVQETINRARAGEGGARSFLTGTDEAAALALEFNKLLDAVAQRDDELRAGEAKSRELIQKIRAAVVVHGADARILTSNALAQELLGLTEEQMAGRSALDPCWHFVGEDGTRLAPEAYPANLVLATGKPLRDTVVGVHRPGLPEDLWVLVGADPVHDERGEVAQVVVTFVDITARREAQRELAERERKLGESQRMAHLGSWDRDLVSGRITLSDQARCIFGLPEEDRVLDLPAWHERWLRLIHPEDRERMGEAYAATLEGNHRYDEEYRILTPGGEERIIHSIAEVVRDGSGHPLSVLGTMQDVTERKKSEQSLKRLNRELRAISECNQVLMRVVDEQTLLLEVCRIVCDQAGYRMAWVGYPEDDDAKTIRPVAWAGAENGYLAQAEITWGDTERGRGPAGRAVREGKTSCFQDFAADPAALPWCDSAAARGYRSLIGLPLKDDTEQTFGVLCIYSTEPHVFTPEEVRLLEELAGDLAFGIVVLRARQRRLRSDRVDLARLRLLQFAASHPLDEFLQATLDEAEELTGSRIACYHFLDEDQEHLSMQNWSTRTRSEFCEAEKGARHYEIPRAGGWSDCVHQRRPVIHNDYDSLPDRKGLPPGHPPVLRELFVPVLRGEKVVAILGVGNKETEYGTEDVEMVSLLADLAWETTVRKRAEEELRDLNQELERRVAERTVELSAKNAELERVNRVFVGRELRMTELKQMVTRLQGERVPSGGEAPLRDEGYRTLFDSVPVPMWEGDFSALRGFLERLRKSGVTDLAAHLAQDPESVRECVARTLIVDANRALLALYGAYDRDELQAGLESTLTPEALETFQKVLLSLWEGETTMVNDTVVKSLSGDPRHVSVYFSVCPGYEETLSRVLISQVDITGRKRVEETLRFVAQRGWSGKTGSFLTSLAQYLGALLNVDYVVIDRLCETPGAAETVALYAKGEIAPNLRYLLHGTPCENVMGKRLCYYPQGVQALFPEDHLLVEMGAESYAGIPLWDASGEGIGLIAVMDGRPFADKEAITQTLQLVAVSAAAVLEREQSDLLLHQREQEFRTLANNIPDLIVRYDSSLSRTFVNHAWEEASGLTASEVVNVPASLIPKVPTPVVGRYLEKLRRVLSGGSTEKVEFSWQNARGDTLFLEYLIVAEHDPEGKIVGVLSVGRDITERKRDEQDRQALLRYFESMDRINRSLQSDPDPERMMGNALDAILEIFACDRAWLIHPCDPEAEIWRVQAERTRPEWPGVLVPNREVAADPELIRLYRTVLAADDPVGFGAENEQPLPADLVQGFHIRSQLSMALYPKVDKPYLFALHQCSAERAWTPEERRILKEIGRRLTDGLTTVLMYRDLQESERRYRLVFENSPVSIWEEDFSGVKTLFNALQAEGVSDLKAYFQAHPEAVRRYAELARVVDVNRAALALHGAADKEELLAGLVQTFTGESFRTFEAELLCLWQGETELTRDAVVKTLGGELRYVTVYFSVCPGYEESLGKILVSLADISARRLAEEALRELNSELELRVDRRTADLDKRHEELAQSQRALINIVEDLNEKTEELVQANAKLKQLDRLKSMFIASMSHELRTPLNSIIGFSSILFNEWTGSVNPEQKENLAIILRSGKHLLNLINDVIDVSKIEAGKVESTAESFDLRDLAAEAVSLVEKDAQEKSLSLQVAVPQVQMHSDRRRLLQCVLNLLSNAVKFSSRGTITFSAAELREEELERRWVEITVADTGIGIRHEDLPKIFHPFVRLVSPGQTIPGTGLGLYLTRKLTVEVLRGDIRFVSEYGRGSEVTLKIPESVV